MLKKKFLFYSLLLILCISLLILSQCADKSTNNQESGNVGMDLKLTTSALLQLVSQLHIVISADDMDTIEVTIPLSEEDGYIYSAAIEVPPGLNRIFMVEVLDDNGVSLYMGVDTSDVSAGINLPLTVYLEPQVSLMKLNPRFSHKMVGSLLNLTYEVFNIEELYEIFLKVYFRSHLLEFISASIDPSLNDATTSLSVEVVHPVTMEPSYLDIHLEGTNNIPIVDENGNGKLINFVFRCLDISIPVESTYLSLDYTSMLDPTGFPPIIDPPLMIDSSLVKIVNNIIIEGDTLPEIPSLLSPADNAVDVVLNPTLQWNAANHTQLYNLVLATDVSFNDVFVTPQYIDGNSYQPPQLMDNTTYFWQVQSLNEAGISDWSETWSFTTLDNTPPSAVSDLQISDTAGTSVTLTWTATGDNGNSGTATNYDIRYSFNSLTENNWNNAFQIIGEPTPQTAGSAETVTINNLALENWYYFGLKTTDDDGNISLISNIDSIFLSSGFTVIPVGFEIDYDALGLNWKADWNTRIISFTWDITGIGTPDGFKIYARDNKSNTDYVEVGDVLYQDFASLQTGTITLPSQFDSHVGDGLQSPFSNGTIIEFNLRAYISTLGQGDFGDVPVSISDENPPVFVIEQTSGDADNSNGEFPFDFTISLDRQLEYCEKSGNPTFTFIENGGDRNYTLSPASVNWTWDLEGRKEDTATVTVPIGECGAGDLMIVTIQDNSGNAYSDTTILLPNITITYPNSNSTEFEAPMEFITWTFAKPQGTYYSNNLDFHLSLDGGLTSYEVISNFAFDTDLVKPYLLNDSLMTDNALIGLKNQGSRTIWWSEPFQINGIKLLHPTSSDIYNYELIFDRGNTDSTLIPMSWSSVGIDDFIIWYSIDYGDSWIAMDTVSNTSYDLYLPNRGTSYSCYLSVTDADADNRPETIFDHDTYGIYVSHDTLYPIVPEPGSWLYAGGQEIIQWSYFGFSDNNITLQYTTDKGDTWKHIATTPNDGSYTWNVPAYESSDDMSIRFRDAHNLNTIGEQLNNLTIVGVKLIYPNGGEIFDGGGTHLMTFDTRDQYGFEVIDIYISTDNFRNDSTHVGYGDVYYLEGSWTAPDIGPTEVMMRIWGGNAFDDSDAPFTIDVGGTK